MSEIETEVTEQTDEDIEEYLLVALAATGFSKGTADVSAKDLKKLKPLLRFYEKKPHPFRACVKDNRKRFGPLTEKYCAIIKDLIKGNTKWRGTERKKNLSQSTLQELFGLPADDGFFTFLSELTEEEVNNMVEFTEEELTETDLAQGDVVWKPGEGFNGIRSKIEAALNEGTGDMGSTHWVEDVSKDKALVCERGKDYWIVPYSVKRGNVVLGEEEEWKPVTRAWVEEKVGFSEEPDLMAEMYFADPAKQEVDEDGYIWKPIIREGVWKYSPGPGQQAVDKPITVVKSGKSDRKKLVISMAELKRNFESGAKEHVTIPTSHDDKVLENTGFIKKLRFSKDSEGRAVLEAAHDFTEPDIKEKAERGTIANTSAGILFDYIQKESGKKFGSVLGHVALTNSPWLNGMKPFGVNASENLEVVGFSDVESNDPAPTGGGEVMSESTFDFSELGFDSADDLKAALSEAATLKAKAKERDIEDRCKTWQEEGKAPALVTEAKAIMMADDGSAAVNFSENGKSTELTASDIVSRLVAATPSVKLSDDPVNDENSSKDEPAEEELTLSQDEKVLAAQLYLGGKFTKQEAADEAKRRSTSETT